MTEDAPPALSWHILGAGSIGCLWAANLALAGNTVTLILKDALAARQFDATPLQLETAAGIHNPAVGAVQAPGLNEPIEWLLVTTKSYSTLEALATVRRQLTPGTKILLLQNGMGIQQQVVEQYPELPVIAGTTTDGAHQKQRFHVTHAGQGHTVFGALHRVVPDQVAALMACLAKLPLGVEWVDDIDTRLWHKVAINSCINALTALKACRNGALLEDEATLATIRSLALEAESVMRAATIAPPRPHLFGRVVEVLRATSANFSSMQQDIAQGRRTEIEHINGFMCAQGRLLNIPTPVNYQLLQAVLTAQR